MLSEILSKQKNIAKDMCSEITIQNEIIDDIQDIMDTADQRLVRNIRNTQKISKKSNSCGKAIAFEELHFSFDWPKLILILFLAFCSPPNPAIERIGPESVRKRDNLTTHHANPPFGPSKYFYPTVFHQKPRSVSNFWPIFDGSPDLFCMFRPVDVDNFVAHRRCSHCFNSQLDWPLRIAFGCSLWDRSSKHWPFNHRQPFVRRL